MTTTVSTTLKKMHFWNHWLTKTICFLSDLRDWANRITLLDLLGFCYLFWPWPIIFLARSGVCLIMGPWLGAQTAWATASFIPSIILLLTVALRGFKYSKSLSILVATFSCCYVFYQNAIGFGQFIYPRLMQEGFFQFMTTVIQSNYLWLLAQVVLLVVMLWSCRYLWVKRDFRSLFKFTNWKFIDFNTLPGARRFKGHTRVLEVGAQGVLKGAGLYSVILSIWPILVIYFGFFSPCITFFIKVSPIIKHLIVGVVPLVVALTAVTLHWLKIGTALSVILACVGNICVGIYNVCQIFNQVQKLFPKQIDYAVIKFLAGLPWHLIGFSLLPFVAVSLSVRYLWSHSNFRKELKLRGFKKFVNYGTAKFLSLSGIQNINCNEGIPIGAIPRVSNFENCQEVVDSIKKYGGDKLIRLKADHTTLVAPSGSGKGVGIVIPTLLEYAGPVYVTDIKGENYTITNETRRKNGKKVYAFDPFDITNSVTKKTEGNENFSRVRLNPLDFLNPNSREIVDDSQTLASLICPTNNQEGATVNYFQSQGAAVIQCLILYIACNDKIKKEDRNLPKVYDCLCSPEEELIELFTRIGENIDLAYGSAANLANRIRATDPRERSGIINSAFNEMKFVDTPSVRDSISCSDVHLADITKGNMDLFICIPPEKLETQSRLLRLLTGIVFIEMQRAKGLIGENNLLMLIDEMPALGHLKQIEEILTYGRGYGVSLMAISQTIELVSKVYPKTWKTFFSNQLSIFFGCSDPMTSEFVSKKLGQKTIETLSVNQSTGTQVKSMDFLGTSSSQSSDATSETGRPLMMKEEIERLGDRVVLAFFRGADPILCQRIDYRERSEWAGQWDENPLHANRKAHNKYSLTEYCKKWVIALMS